jgi:hypothetical protein
VSASGDRNSQARLRQCVTKQLALLYSHLDEDDFVLSLWQQLCVLPRSHQLIKASLIGDQEQVFGISDELVERSSKVVSLFQ